MKLMCGLRVRRCRIYFCKSPSTSAGASLFLVSSPGEENAAVPGMSRACRSPSGSSSPSADGLSAGSNTDSVLLPHPHVRGAGRPDNVPCSQTGTLSLTPAPHSPASSAFPSCASRAPASSCSHGLEKSQRPGPKCSSRGAPHPTADPKPICPDPRSHDVHLVRSGKPGCSDDPDGTKMFTFFSLSHHRNVRGIQICCNNVALGLRLLSYEMLWQTLLAQRCYQQRALSLNPSSENARGLSPCPCSQVF